MEKREMKMKKRRPLKILFVGDEAIGLLIQLELRDRKFMDKVIVASTVDRAVEILRELGSSFDLVLPMNLVEGETGSAQEVIRVTREVCPEAYIIQIGSFSAERKFFSLAADRICEMSCDFGELMKMIREHFG